MLTAIPGSPFADCGVTPYSLVVDPAGKYLYAANVHSNNISVFRINATSGALTEIPESRFATGGSNSAFLAVDPTDQFLYVTNTFSNNISAFTINTASGSLKIVPGSPFEAGTNPFSIAVAPLFTASVSPDAGSAAEDNFAFQYSDSRGVSFLTSVYAGFGPTAYADHSCWARYDRSTNELYLRNDDGTAFVGPVTPGAQQTLSNSQCTLDASGSEVISSGNILTVDLEFTFKPAFAGPQGNYMYAVDQSGATTPGWLKRGTWDVP